MEQFDLFIAPEPHPGSFFSDQQIKALQDISKKLPKIVKFLVADKFDDKFIISKMIFGTFIIQDKEKI